MLQLEDPIEHLRGSAALFQINLVIVFVAAIFECQNFRVVPPPAPAIAMLRGLNLNA